MKYCRALFHQLIVRVYKPQSTNQNKSLTTEISLAFFILTKRIFSWINKNIQWLLITLYKPKYFCIQYNTM